jgi:hypothetical protein
VFVVLGVVNNSIFDPDAVPDHVSVADPIMYAEVLYPDPLYPLNLNEPISHGLVIACKTVPVASVLLAVPSVIFGPAKLGDGPIIHLKRIAPPPPAGALFIVDERALIDDDVEVIV